MIKFLIVYIFYNFVFPFAYLSTMGLPDTPDLFQDGVILGVKELFESYENELLPINQQLKLYKKRDLFASHKQRTSRKVLKTHKHLCRHYLVDENPFAVVRTELAALPEQISELDLPLEESDLDLSDWVKKREKLRTGLNQMGLSMSWLERKPNKTCLEQKLLAKMKSDDMKTFVSDSGEESSLKCVKASVLKAVKKITQYISKKQAPFKFFNASHFDNVEITRKQCEDGLTKLQELIRLSDKEKDDILSFYYDKKLNKNSFYEALFQALQTTSNISSSNPFITVTPASDESRMETDEDKILNTQKSAVSHAQAMDLQKDLRLKECNDVFQKYLEKGMGFDETVLEKVLLHPSDKAGFEPSPFVKYPQQTLLPENFWKNREKRRSKRLRRRLSSASPDSKDSDEDKPKERETSQPSIISLPPLRDVAPDKHHMNLSTGRALVGRKVDCWMSEEEYIQITRNPYSLPLEREPADPNAFWPGQDKSRLWMTPRIPHKPADCEKARGKGNIFQQVGVRRHNGKKANNGYNNNLLTWPTDGKHVKYGDIDRNKVYVI